MGPIATESMKVNIFCFSCEWTISQVDLSHGRYSCSSPSTKVLLAYGDCSLGALTRVVLVLAGDDVEVGRLRLDFLQSSVHVTWASVSAKNCNCNKLSRFGHDR